MGNDGHIIDADKPLTTPCWCGQVHAEPHKPEYWVDEKGNLHPKPHKVKVRWQETARDLVLFPLLKLAALILALIICGALASGGSVPYELG